MIQDQLVEYITSQIKAGVSADTVKATLVAAGWQTADVDDTIKKVQGPSVATATVMGAAAAVTAGAAATAPASMTVGPKTISTTKSEPQTIRVSDLVSTSTSAASKAAEAQAAATKKFLTPNVSPTATSYQAPGTRGAAASSSSASSSRGPLTTEILLGILMVAFGALAAYFLFANRSLSAQVATLTAQSTGVSTQVSTLQNQLDASTTALTAELSSTTLQNEELALNLSFYAVPVGTVAAPTSTTTLVGSVSGGGTKSYVITTSYGVKVIVANSKDPKVVTMMQPLVGTTTVPFGGTYTPGVASITLTVINGVSLLAPSEATSTATSTASAAPMIPAPTTSAGK